LKRKVATLALHVPIAQAYIPRANSPKRSEAERQAPANRGSELMVNVKQLSPAFLADAVATLVRIFAVPCYPSVTEVPQLTEGELVSA
jgi:hypothetical protein